MFLPAGLTALLESDPNLITAPQAAKLRGVSLAAIHLAAQAGRFPCMRFNRFIVTTRRAVEELELSSWHSVPKPRRKAMAAAIPVAAD